MLFVGTSIIHPSTEGVFLLCNILDLLIYSKEIEKHCWKVRGGFEEAMKNYCTLKELGYKFEEYE